MNYMGFINEVTLGGYLQFYVELLLPLLCLGIHCKKRSFFYLRLIPSFAISIPLYFLPALSLFGINFSYLICFGVLVAAAFFLYEEPPFIIVATTSAAFAIQHLLWNIIAIIFGLMPHVDSFQKWSISLSYYLMYGAFVLLIALVWFKTKLRIFINRSLPIVMTVATAIVFITWLLSQYISEWTVVNRLYTILATSFALMCLYLFPALMKGTEDSMMLRNEKVVLENLIEQQARQNDTSAELREIMRIHIHDLRHELEAIETYSDEEKKNYIEKVRADLDMYQGFAKTGNETVDIILTEKSLLCQTKGIRFNYIVDGEALSVLPKADMVALVGNMLDNAIEASSKEEGENRLIKFHVQAVHGLLSIECVNFAHSISSFSIEDYSSSKTPDGQIHGYGIKSMKYIAKRYGGSVSFELKGGIFTVQAVLPIPTK